MVHRSADGDLSSLDDLAAAEALRLEKERLERGRLLFAGPCDFVKGVVQLDHLPEAVLPEVAFAGRSNVGKSSLINGLTGRKYLARASNTPGRTRELNYFDLGGRLWLVDMPGYGYAEAAKSDVARWTELIMLYLRGRANLNRVFLLIDSRHGVKANDLETMKMLDAAAVVYQLVLTKADKLSTEKARQEVYELTLAAVAKRPAAFPEVIMTSSETGRGMDLLRAAVADFALQK
ncbi:MAG: ribosome biogenesis GTP-binding protein YihA/YsxC [Candidatus Pacebacteria bacterium]|nr:ribosome biogenesis GTP-binding protein YihA/YsxC [Candidatus Paceibacterota bacterium]